MARKDILTRLDGGNGDIKVGFTSEAEMIVPEAGFRTLSGDPVLFPEGLGATLADYADDATAAAGGVAVGGLYRNGSVVQVRVA